jgi:hypothetical protein
MESLSTIQKRYRDFHPPGKTCIFTICGGDYQAFAPLFIETAVAANPECDVMVGVIGENWIGWQPGIIDCNGLPDRNRLSSAMRFVWSNGLLESFDYVLITDIDIVFAPEATSIATTHLIWMDIEKTAPYSNWLIGKEQIPGVHFITKEWWAKTAEARKKEFDTLMTLDNIPYFYDELMLYRIIHNSGLPLPGKLPQLWNHHGLHLGSVRDFEKQKGFQVPDAAGLAVLLSGRFDKEIGIASSRFPWIDRFIEYAKSI